MKSERIKLNRTISVEDFLSFYWLKKELHKFCSDNGLSTAGSKHEIQDRIAQFLRTGTIKKPKQTSPPKKQSSVILSLNAVIPSGFTCTREARNFFIEHAGNDFKYTVLLQRYLKAHPGITFGQLIDEWKRLTAQKKAGLKTEIDSQFEYNQFTRDFFADPTNQGKTRADCIAAWRTARNRRGAHTYVAYKKDEPGTQ